VHVQPLTVLLGKRRKRRRIASLNRLRDGCLSGIGFARTFSQVTPRVNCVSGENKPRSRCVDARFRRMKAKACLRRPRHAFLVKEAVVPLIDACFERLKAVFTVCDVPFAGAAKIRAK
jgi:hypothetical protein